ncbi:MAG: KilA-N domain-containing protein [Methylococcaceae bacterium]
MHPARIEVPYNGQSFFIDIADGKMVNLNRIYEISGASSGKDPRRWIGLESTKILIKSIDVVKSDILKTKRGGANGGGGTWAHWQLALSYAQYLSPDLHLAINQVFKERLEETIDPELGIARSRERAKVAWKNQGHDDEWITKRELHIDTRKAYTGTLIEHDVKPGHEIGQCTNKIYKGIFNKDKAEIEQGIRESKPNLPKKVNIRDHAKLSSLAAIGLAEALASEEIAEFDVRGVKDCGQVSFDKGMSVRLALQDSRSKAPKKPVEKTFNAESHKKGIAGLRDALKGK